MKFTLPTRTRSTSHKVLRSGRAAQAPAFTLLELLISIALSSVVMLGLMQGYRSTMTFIENSQEMIHTNRRVFLLFNQLDKDFSTAFIPVLNKEIKPVKERTSLKDKTPEQEEEAKKHLTPEQKKKAKAEEKEKKKEFFWGLADDGEMIKVEGKRLQLFKNVTFISTNPLQVYGEKRVRFVRLKYELVVNKQKSSRDKKNYQLVRKETADIADVKMKVSEFDDKAKKSALRTHVVADNIKGMYVTYITYKEEKKDEKEKKKTVRKSKEELPSFTWGEKDYSKGFVPQRIEIRIEFWNESMTAHHAFQTVVPVWSYPTIEEEEEKKKEREEKEAGEGQAIEKTVTEGKAAMPGAQSVAPSPMQR